MIFKIIDRITERYKNLSFYEDVKQDLYLAYMGLNQSKVDRSYRELYTILCTYCNRYIEKYKEQDSIVCYSKGYYYIEPDEVSVNLDRCRYIFNDSPTDLLIINLYIQGYSVTDIAKYINKTKQAVSKRLSKIKDKVKDKYVEVI